MSKLPRMTALASAAFMITLLVLPVSVHAKELPAEAAGTEIQNVAGIDETGIDIANIVIPTAYGMPTSIAQIGFIPSNVREVFDSTYYAEHNPDVVEALGANPEELYQHFIDHGLAEGRIGSIVLDIAKYRLLYPDLDAFFGYNWDLYVQHFFTTGLLEGRDNGFRLTAEQTREEAETSPAAVQVSADGTITDGAGSVLIPWENVSTYHYLTLEELREKLGDSLILIQDSDGNVTFIGGTFTDSKVHNVQDARNALHQLMKLMNFPEDREELYLTKTNQDSNGNQYYRFSAKLRESVNDRLLSDTAIVLGADPNGNVLCMSSCNATRFYTDDAEALSQIGFNQEKWDNTYQWYAPKVSNGHIREQPVLKYYGNWNHNQFYWTMIVEDENSILEIPLTERESAYDIVLYDTSKYAKDTYGTSESYTNDFYFRPSKDDDPRADVTELSFKDAYGFDVVLPVAWSAEKQQYYICDRDRKMVCLDNYDDTQEVLNPKLYYISPDMIHDGSVSPEALDGKFVTAFHNLQSIRDIYQQFQLLDEHDTILVNLHPNSMEMAASATWQLGSASINLYNNDITVSYDVLAHEFSHEALRILGANLQRTGQGEAIHEAYADILGNLLEMITSLHSQTFLL